MQECIFFITHIYKCMTIFSTSGAITPVIGKTNVDINKIEFNSKKIIKNDLFIARRQ